MKKLFLALLLLLALAFFGFTLPAAAHEGREVGHYEIELGWRSSSTYWWREGQSRSQNRWFCW